MNRASRRSIMLQQKNFIKLTKKKKTVQVISYKRYMYLCLQVSSQVPLVDDIRSSLAHSETSCIHLTSAMRFFNADYAVDETMWMMHWCSFISQRF